MLSHITSTTGMKTRDKETYNLNTKLIERTMESCRKRRVSETCGDGRQPHKKIDRRVRDSKHERLPVNAVAVEVFVNSTYEDGIPRNDTTIIQTSALRETTTSVPNLTKANLVTPRNSFLELRPTSSSLDGNNDMQQLYTIRATDDGETSRSSSYPSDDDSVIIRGSPTFKTSSEHELDPSSIFAVMNPKETISHHQVVASMKENTNTMHVNIYTKERISCSLSSKRVGYERRWSVKALIFMTAMYIGMRFLASMLFESVVIEDKNSIYVPGGGFSGFWYTLGRLNSIEDPLSKKYYCYSAGCLGVVTMLGNITMESAHMYAVDAQTRWSQGDLSRYDVTKSFIDGLLYGSDDPKAITRDNLRPAFRDERILSTLRIITSKRDDNGGVKAAIRTPANASELKEMLLQTTWIPFVVNRDLWHEEHMDGAFTLFEHPWCPTKLGYSFEWDLILNSLNVNLARDKAKLLWQMGLAKGA